MRIQPHTQSDPRQLGTTTIPATVLPPTWRVLARGGRLTLPLDGPNLHSFLTGVGNEEARKMVGGWWCASGRSR